MTKEKVCTFVTKLYKILSNEKNREAITWNSNSSFQIRNKEKLCNEILPSNFKSSSYTSFIRQLNKYDFRKVRGTNIFKHPYFRRNDISRFKEIIPKGTYGTFREIKKNKLSISLFNCTVFKTLEKICCILEKMENQFYFNSVNKNRILVFEDYDFEDMAIKLKNHGFKVKQVNFYSDFETKICTEFYNYLIIDQNFYEIFRREDYELENLKKIKIIVTWRKDRIKVQSNMYKIIEKPYTVSDLISILSIKN